MWLKKEEERNHLRLCLGVAHAGDTLTALTEPLIETRRLPPEAHAAAALMQAQGIYSAAQLKSNLNRGDCRICFCHLFKKLCI